MDRGRHGRQCRRDLAQLPAGLIRAQGVTAFALRVERAARDGAMKANHRR
jgi:hypothetical protein